MQHFDGTIEGMDMDVWRGVNLESAQAPEDWSGSVDIAFEDLPDPEGHAGNGWQNPLELIDRLD